MASHVERAAHVELGDPRDRDSAPPHRKRRLLRVLIPVLGLLLVIGALAAIKGAQIGKLIAFGKEAERAGPPPEAVGSAIVKTSTWEGNLAAVGTVTST